MYTGCDSCCCLLLVKSILCPFFEGGGVRLDWVGAGGRVFLGLMLFNTILTSALGSDLTFYC